MTFTVGDRVRWTSTADDGLPWVRYGFIGGETRYDGTVIVLLDDELGHEVIDTAQLCPVTFLSTELRLAGTDLLDDPSLRRGLVQLWHAEAESAGLAIDELVSLGDGRPDGPHRWTLAHIVTSGARYLLQAGWSPADPETVRVGVEPASRARWAR